MPAGVYATASLTAMVSCSFGLRRVPQPTNGLIRRIATGELIALSDRYVVANECDATYQYSITVTAGDPVASTHRAASDRPPVRY